MGEKVAAKNEGQKNTAAEAVVKAAAAAAAAAVVGGGEKAEPPMTVVLKLDLHCEGCAKKVKRSVRTLEGVVTVKTDCDAKKLTVTGNVDPTWLRDRVEIKTKKKVDLISPLPQPNKDAGGGAAGAEKKAEGENKVDDTKKPKKAVVSTVTMKTKLHCDGCAHKIKRIIIKNIDGVDSLSTNLEKDLIIVTGTMDGNNLVTFLREKLKRGVEIVPPKKDDATEKPAAKEIPTADVKEKAPAAPAPAPTGQEKKDGESKGEGGAKPKEADAGAKKEPAEPKPAAEETKVEMSKMEYHGSYINPQTHYAMMPMAMNNGHQDYGMMMHHDHHQGYGHVAAPPPPPPTYLQDTYSTNDGVFSEENPNGCHVM